MDLNIIRHLFFSKSSRYQPIFIINFLRNEKQFYWFSYFNKEYCHCCQDCSSILYTPRKWSFYLQTIFVINFL